MISTFIGIGGNLQQPINTVLTAIAQLKHIEASEYLGASSLYRSKPMGPSDQPDYINAVVKLKTHLSPLSLLDKLQALEQQQGRQRNGERWGPRTLDLDILLYGTEQLQHPRLTIPHYHMREREFVIHPLYQLQPDLVFDDGVSLAQLIQQIPANGIEKLTI